MADLTKPVIDRTKCTVCGICVDTCPEDVLAVNKDALILAKPEACTMCAECEGVCPEGAVRVYYQIGWADEKE